MKAFSMSGAVKKIVVVHWQDAGSGCDKKEAAGHKRYSVGFLVKHSSKGIYLAMEAEAGSNLDFIPKRMIKNIVPLQFNK